MSKDVVLYKDSKIKYKGVFDFSLLYKKLRVWYMESGYEDPIESKYAEKVKPDGKQIEVVWETKKKEEEGYFEIVQEVKIYITGMQEVEVEKDGEKTKLDKGLLELTFNSKLVCNADKSKGWNESSLMFKIYERFIIKYRVEELKIDTYKHTTKIMDEVKNLLNLYRF